MARKLDPTRARPSTLAIHAGEEPDPATGASSPNIVMSSTYVTDRPEGFSAHELTEDSPFVYSRWANPTVRALEEKMAVLEGAEACACYGSGMGAAAAIILSLLSAGDHMILSDVSYAGIAELVRDTLPRFGIEVSLVNCSKPDDVEDAIRPETKLIFIDTPCNPIMRLTDMQGDRAGRPCAQCAGGGGQYFRHAHRHEAARFRGRSGDALADEICRRARRCAGRLRVRIVGVDPATDRRGDGALWRVDVALQRLADFARGAATLPLRMRAHQEGALAVGRFLEQHPKVEAVVYPGLPSHPQHNLARHADGQFFGHDDLPGEGR